MIKLKLMSKLTNLQIDKKSNFYHSIKISLKISTNKLQEQIQSDFSQIT
jgi:predicted nuclease of restriction endonuclease-like (RecB) superfamily